MVSSEHSSGNRIQRGRITKAGNAHLRRVVVEAWAYRNKPWVGGALLKRQQGLDQAVKDIAWKDQPSLSLLPVTRSDVFQKTPAFPISRKAGLIKQSD